MGGGVGGGVLRDRAHRVSRIRPMCDEAGARVVYEGWDLGAIECKRGMRQAMSPSTESLCIYLVHYPLELGLLACPVPFTPLLARALTSRGAQIVLRAN